MTRGLLSQVIGGWRLGAIQVYASGLPLAVTRNNPLPIFNGADRPSVTTYDGWLMPVDGRFDPAKNLVPQYRRVSHATALRDRQSDTLQSEGPRLLE